MFEIRIEKFWADGSETYTVFYRTSEFKATECAINEMAIAFKLKNKNKITKALIHVISKVKKETYTV